MNPFQSYSTEDVILTAIAVVVIFSCIIAILYCIWGGFLMIISGGKEEKIKPAINHIRYACIGIILLVLIIFIAPKVLSLFSLPYSDVIRPNRIFGKINELSEHIFSPLLGRSSYSEKVLPSESDLPADFSDL